MTKVENDELRQEIDPELTKGLFVNEDDEIPAPAPAPAPAPKSNEELEEAAVANDFTSDDVLELICSENEDGYSPSLIDASLQKIHNISDDTDFYSIPEDDVEYVDDIVLQNCSVDLYSLNSNIVNLRLTFDSPNDAYLKELNQMLNRYRVMQDEVIQETDGKYIIPVFSISFMPFALNGHGIMRVTAPIAYFRTLSDNNTNAVMHMMFDINNVDVSRIELSADELAEIDADVLRSIETSTQGQLFEQ